MITSEIIDEINETLDNGNTSYSSVCNIIDTDKEIGIQFLRQAFLKKEYYLKESSDFEKKMKESKFLSGSSLTAIKHILQHLKIELPFTTSYGEEVLVVKSLEDMEVIQKI